MGNTLTGSSGIPTDLVRVPSLFHPQLPLLYPSLLSMADTGELQNVAAKCFDRYNELLCITGFFKGTSADQDRRFSDKELKLLKTMKFPPEFEKKVFLASCLSHVSETN